MKDEEKKLEKVLFIDRESGRNGGGETADVDIRKHSI